MLISIDNGGTLTDACVLHVMEIFIAGNGSATE